MLFQAIFINLTAGAFFEILALKHVPLLVGQGLDSRVLFLAVCTIAFFRPFGLGFALFRRFAHR